MKLLDSKLTSKFGWRKNPTDKGKQFHTGLDLVSKDKSVSAFIGGVIRRAQEGKYGEGLYIQIKTILFELKLYANYMHNERNLVHEGERVHGAEYIAVQGSTGNSTGIHTHFEIFFMDSQLDIEFAKDVLKRVKHARIGHRVFLEPYSLEKYFIKKDIL